MGLDQDRLVTIIGTAAIHIVAHDVVHQMEGIILAKGVVEPLQRVISSHKALEHTCLGVEVILQRFGAVVSRTNKFLGTGRDKH